MVYKHSTTGLYFQPVPRINLFPFCPLLESPGFLPVHCFWGASPLHCSSPSPAYSLVAATHLALHSGVCGLSRGPLVCFLVEHLQEVSCYPSDKLHTCCRASEAQHLHFLFISPAPISLVKRYLKGRGGEAAIALCF